MFVYAFAANGVLGLVPQLEVTVTLTGLLMRLALPVALIVLGVLEFALPRDGGRRPRAGEHDMGPDLERLGARRTGRRVGALIVAAVLVLPAARMVRAHAVLGASRGRCGCATGWAAAGAASGGRRRCWPSPA